MQRGFNYCIKCYNAYAEGVGVFLHAKQTKSGYNAVNVVLSEKTNLQPVIRLYYKAKWQKLQKIDIMGYN